MVGVEGGDSFGKTCDRDPAGQRFSARGGLGVRPRKAQSSTETISGYKVKYNTDQKYLKVLSIIDLLFENVYNTSIFKFTQRGCKDACAINFDRFSGSGSDALRG